MELEEIKDVLKTKLSEKRFYHSLCVMDMCEKLALHYNVNPDVAKLVGLAHDIAKEMPSDEKIKYAKENNIPVNNVELASQGLLHAKIGADICKKQFGFSDVMCKAISLHTTGGEDMDMLSKILFIGDGIGLDRTYEGAKPLWVGILRINFTSKESLFGYSKHYSNSGPSEALVAVPSEPQVCLVQLTCCEGGGGEGL